ncbi:MAG: shikimate dehydrogenase [Gemmatimonadaceae bacterium]
MTVFRADAVRTPAVSPRRLVLVGHPVAHSLSPIFQNAALEAAGLSVSYEAIDVEPSSVKSILESFKESGVAGNVTIPHKVAVHNACDDLTELAARVRAVNTFWVDSGRLVGDNTDVAGFTAAAAALLQNDFRSARVVILGAGGAAAAILAAVTDWPAATATVASRDFDRALALARRFPDVGRAEMDMGRALSAATLVVNATPIGQYDNAHPIDLEKVAPAAAVMDLVYRRGGTAWVKSAREKGFRAADGLEMLIEQGALSFNRWFGIQPDREVMRRSVS